MTGNASKVGLRCRFVVFKREYQRDVDVDPLGSQHLDSRNALEGGGYLDHDVRPRDHLPQMSSLGDRCAGIVSGAWRHFEADEPVCAITMVVHGAKDISCQLDVLDDQTFSELAVAQFAAGIECTMQRGVVI